MKYGFVERQQEQFAVAALFEWDPRARAIVEAAVTEAGMRLAGWREVPLPERPAH